MVYFVEVVIRNKRVARDPEGETLFRELLSRSKYKDLIKSVRSGKWLLFEVEAGSREEAVDIINKMCKEMRIYNPVVHEIEVRSYQGGRGKVSGD